MDHDQRFKNLIMEFFREFIALFWPHWAARFDFDSLDWLMQEVFVDPPKGKRRELDLVAKLKVRSKKGKLPNKAWLALVHVEIESRKSMRALRKRVHDYYHELRKKHRLPVLPIVVLLNVGLDGVGVQTYEEHFGEFQVVDFRFLYVGLPGLDGTAHLEGENLLGAALAPLMQIPDEQRAETAVRALQRLSGSNQSDLRKQLLGECVLAYSPLTEQQEQEFQALLQSETYAGVQAMRKTWHEEGEEKGQRDLLQHLIESRFGPLKKNSLKKLEQWPVGKLPELGQALMTATSLKELGLEK